MRKVGYIALLLLAFCAASCGRKKAGEVSVIPLTIKILNDTSSMAYKNISLTAADRSKGTVAVIGAPEDVIRLCENLVSCDMHDNISGKIKSDGLPDFAGETFSEILDFANYPYEEYVALNNAAFLKEINVRNFLSAIDTVCLQSPYDSASRMYRQRAKFVIFASSSASVYGFHDIDSLCRNVGPESVKVLTPVRSMYDYAASRHGEGAMNILVWGEKDKIDNGIYSSVLDDVLAVRGDASDYRVYCSYRDSADTDGPERVRKEFLNVLDCYIAGEGGKIDAILLDDRSVSGPGLDSLVTYLSRTDDDNLLIYKNILSREVICVSAAKAISEQCYSYLRKENAFTHRISYPDLQFFITYPSVDLPEDVYDVDGGFSFAYKYSRKPDSGRSTFSLVKMRDRYFPETMEDYMETNAPKSYSIYVR